VHDLNELKAAAVRDFFFFDWDSKLVFEGRQMKLFRFEKRQFSQ
jgi:hypothetical protein